MTVREMFEKHKDIEHCHFERVESKRNKRKDLHAFLLLDEVSGDPYSWIIEHASDDKIYLNSRIDNLKESQVIELLRCGVFYDEDADLLAMHV